MKEKILELRRKGLSINQIVKELGCAKSTAFYHMNRAGLGGTRAKFIVEFDDDFIEKIKQYRLELKTYDEIRKICDISEDKLKKICRMLNLTQPLNHEEGVKFFDKTEVLGYYLKIKSLKKTAKFFNISFETLRKHYIGDNELIQKVSTKKDKIQSVIDWRKRTKIKLVEYKGGKCEICGYNKCIAALEFHHKDASEKDFTISGKSYSFDRQKLEVDKCIMVCANCHTEIHEEIRLKSNKG